MSRRGIPTPFECTNSESSTQNSGYEFQQPACVRTWGKSRQQLYPKPGQVSVAINSVAKGRFPARLSDQTVLIESCSASATIWRRRSAAWPAFSASRHTASATR